MNYKRILQLAFIIALMPLLVEAKEARIKENFDFDWLFHLGDVPQIASPDFEPEANFYDIIQLPHDWCTGLEFNKQNGSENAFLEGGIGWYRKAFYVDSHLKNKKISIVFDGVYHKATVFLNGNEIAYHCYGYTSFEVDLTPYILWGKQNVISVRVENLDKSRWYTGAGIYRHVWLQIVNPIHVMTWGTYITTPQVSEESAMLLCKTNIVNTSTQTEKVEVIQSLLDCMGGYVNKKNCIVSSLVELKSGEIKETIHEMNIKKPMLWDIERPYLYTLMTTIKKNGKVIDCYQTPLGIRSIKFDSKDGFFLNGKPTKLKGVCLHQDAGCLGVAVPNRSYRKRLETLKGIGVNAVRCSHNPPSPEFLDYCDQLGLLVIDESFDKWKNGYYGAFFDKCWRQDIGNMVIRDRNHPSIILWSIGNELAEAGRKDNVGVERAKMLNDYVHELDPTRPTMLALAPQYEDKFASVTDVIGYNYGELSYIEDKKKHPERIGLISESYPYYSGMKPYESRSYSSINPWNYVKEYDFICGAFIWAGVDYWGESMGWPSKGWPATLFDMCMEEKPIVGYFKAQWLEKPVLSIAVLDYSLDCDLGKDHWQTPPLIHDWTLPYTDERVIPIHTPSNCEEVILIDPRGKKYGPLRPDDYANNTIIWNQPYRPGKVTVIGYNDGIEVCSDSIMTTGSKAESFVVSSDCTQLKADGQDIAHLSLQLIDEKGLPIKVDDRLISVHVEGCGRLLGINNGDVRRSFKLNSDKLPTFQGKGQIIIQSGKTKGTIKVKVNVEGLGQQELSLVIIG